MIERIGQSDQGLSVWLVGRTEPLLLPWIWVRDHSEDDTAYDHELNQRTVNSFSIDPEQKPASAEVVNGQIQVDWGDGSARSILTAKTFGNLTNDQAAKRLWRTPDSIEQSSHRYEDIIESQTGLENWLDSIQKYGFAMASGVPQSVEAAQTLADRLGYVRRTVFGDMWTLSSEIAPHADSAYGQSFLEPHTDGSYSHDGPGLQLFACAERSGNGGESVLVDGFAAANELRNQDADAFAILTEVDVPAHYIEPGVSLRASRPTIRTNKAGEVQQITFNNYDRSPFLLEPEQMLAWYQAYSAFHELIVNRSAWWTRRLDPGDALIFDNWRCLHGRLAYTGKRVFNGCYLNHEDLESRIRLS